MTRIEKISLSIVSLVAIVTIVETAYLGINGSHSFRQADVYGHILGILEQRNFESFDLFATRIPWGTKAVFDIPLYEYSVATISWALNKDPLVSVRYFNLVIWIITAASGYAICRQLTNQLAAILFVVFVSTSRVYLHYYSVPMPDVLAIALSLCAILVLIHNNTSLWRYVAALALVVLAAMVKSPVPFVFLVFLAILKFQDIHVNGMYSKENLQSHSRFFLFLFLCLLFTVAVEYYRGLLMDSTGSGSGHLWKWYFGSVDLRLSLSFWKEILSRSDQWLSGFFIVFIVVQVSVYRWFYSETNKKILVAALAAFFSGWLIFSNVYKIHNYYQLPVGIIMFISLASSISCLIQGLVSKSKISLSIASYFPLIVSVILLLNFSNQRSYGEKYRTGFWQAVEFALTYETQFLFVSDNLGSPVSGGRVSTKFDEVKVTDFESNCPQYLANYNSILVESTNSACIDGTEFVASYLIRDKNRIFLKQ